MIADHIVQSNGPARDAGIETEQGQIGHLPAQAARGFLVETGHPLPQTGYQHNGYGFIFSEDSKLREPLFPISRKEFGGGCETGSYGPVSLVRVIEVEALLRIASRRTVHTKPVQKTSPDSIRISPRRQLLAHNTVGDPQQKHPP